MLLAVLAGTATGAVIDLASRRIPDAVTLSMAAVGVGLAAGGWSGVSILSSAAGAAAGLALMLPGHLLGGTGAGDVKLFAAVGAVVGVERMPIAFGYTALAGGMLALAFALSRGRLRATLAGTIRLLRAPRAARRALATPSAANRFPYGPAIAAGSTLAVVLGG